MTDTMQADMNWFAVLAHREPHSGPGDHRVPGRDDQLRGHGRAAAALASGLAARGVAQGDVVALLAYNCPEFLETVFAANYLGAIAMPINWRLAASEVRYILDHSGARALVCDEALFGLGCEATKGLEPNLVRACISPTAADGWLAVADLRTGSGRVEPVPAAPDDIHRLMYTSGTTGRPKGVMLTHANLAWKNLAHLVEFGFTRGRWGSPAGRSTTSAPSTSPPPR